MSLSRRIFYNTVAQTLGKAVAALIGLVTVALLTRYLAERGFGQYSTVVAFLGFFVVLADFGLYLYVVREISKPGANRGEIISAVLGLRLSVAAGALLLGALIALFLPYDPIVKKTMFLGVAAFLFVSLNQVLVGIFQKHLVQYLLVLAETIGRLVNLALVYFFMRSHAALPAFLLALVAGNFATFCLTFILARRYETFGISFHLPTWGKILRNAWPLIFAVILNLIYFKTDTIILSLFKSPQIVGVYSLPYKLLEGLLAFPAMFVGLIMPLLSEYAFHSWEKFQDVLQRAFDALVLMGSLVVVVFLFFPKQIIDLVKGPQAYTDSAALLQILIFAAAIIFLGTLFGYAVVAVNEQKAMIKGYLSGAVVGLGLYLLLIPKFSYWGAAVGTVISEAVVAGVAYYLVRKTSQQRLSLRILLPAIPALLLMVIFFKLVSFAWILEIAAGAGLYILALLAFKAVPLKFIKDVLFLK